MTAILEKIALERDQMAARQFATQICHVLEAHIPQRCFGDAILELTAAMVRENVELTNREVRRQHETMQTALRQIAGGTLDMVYPLRAMPAEEMRRIASEALPHG